MACQLLVKEPNAHEDHVMKNTSKKRLRLEVSTIRNLATDELRRVNAGLPTDDSESSNTVTMSPGPTYACSVSCVQCNA
jgi:hypothetical protein